MSSIKDSLKDLKGDDVPTRSVEKKGDRRKSCSKCGKTFSYHKRDCRIPILKLKWNGTAWQRDNSCEKWYYQMKLGRDLDNLVRKRSINEDVLNSNQKSYLQMYRELFTD